MRKCFSVPRSGEYVLLLAGSTTCPLALSSNRCEVEVRFVTVIRTVRSRVVRLGAPEEAVEIPSSRTDRLFSLAVRRLLTTVRVAPPDRQFPW
jgi:hypothetical protein